MFFFFFVLVLIYIYIYLFINDFPIYFWPRAFGIGGIWSELAEAKGNEVVKKD